jgi:predicted nuclease with RNAse H fold
VLYCGIAVGLEHHHLCALEEVLVEEPPVRLQAVFFEPGTTDQVMRQLLALGGNTVIAVGAPFGEPAEGRPARTCDAELERRGVPVPRFLPAGGELSERLAKLGIYAPPEDTPAGAVEGAVAEGAYQAAPVFETNPEGVFCALQGRRLPARRHPLGIQRRIGELVQDQVIDPGGDLWHRRIEEIEAAAAALAAHRYAVGHASWLGDPSEGVVVLPGASVPERFSVEGVIPPVPRAPLMSGEA